LNDQWNSLNRKKWEEYERADKCFFKKEKDNKKSSPKYV
jgi:hypothetical protein